MPALKRRTLLLAALGGPLGGAVAAVDAQAAPLRLIVPFAPGGGVDAAARVLAGALAPRLGTPVLVENHPGASGTIGGRLVLGAAPDGRTLLFSAATHVFTRQVLARPPYDPQADFAPVARFGRTPLLLVVAPGRGERDLQQLLAAIRAEPGGWSAGVPAYGAPGHLAMLDLERRAGLKLNLVPYKGTQPALMDVAGGHADLLLDSLVALQPLARAGRVRALAISAADRSPLLPRVPTFAEAGLPAFVHHSWYGLWAPRDTPDERIEALAQAVAGAAAALESRQALRPLGLEAAVLGSDEFRIFVTNELAAGSELLRQSGFHVD
ncbi:tripartite-type tricarboxylate transporter receptor subunit TctC [Rubrivivax gelatinosus]|uniref:tripartite tricarboxylate transporter substrate binding protein n=2 Tax=Rubrivivax gelatinosus TaxID=28068 RepID=UPI0018C966BB|nr:tripartite tricarboxylate transporter substrate binding protein [Rubrivivax gelatinosus]MBG6080552.1 tripartite-type tricarboxylate transporter receptor subunit TctC [Rubrivivax gelatinosus]